MISKRYDLSELIKRWEREQITTEQAIGQILLWLVALVEQMAKIEINNRKANNLP
ncbi:MAG: hypothetical protein JXM69_09270 [Anaerolineae bacterium]|nr:hypothetical protein [Anaerolineae bacterium]